MSEIPKQIKNLILGISSETTFNVFLQLFKFEGILHKDIRKNLNMGSGLLSYHLNVLKNNGFIKEKKSGYVLNQIYREIFGNMLKYKINDKLEVPKQKINEIIKAGNELNKLVKQLKASV